jgi:hypothetical protein
MSDQGGAFSANIVLFGFSPGDLEIDPDIAGKGNHV